MQSKPRVLTRKKVNRQLAILYEKKFDESFFQPIKIRMAVEVKNPVIELLSVLIFIIMVKMETSNESVAEKEKYLNKS